MIIKQGIWTLFDNKLSSTQSEIELSSLFTFCERKDLKLWYYPIYVFESTWSTEQDALDVVELISIAQVMSGRPQKPERDAETINYILYHNGFDVTNLRFFGT